MRKQLGLLIREARKSAGLGVTETGNKAGWTRQKQHALERGTGSYTAADLRHLGYLFGLPKGEVDFWEEMGLNAHAKQWFESFGEDGPKHFGMYLSLESLVKEYVSVNEENVNGLLQTEAYHRALMGIGDQPPQDVIERSVLLRIERRERFWSRPEVRMTAMIAEAALTHQVGGPAVTDDLMRHLLELTARDGVSIRVLLSKTGGHPAMSLPFVLLTGEFGCLAYVEHIDIGRVVPGDQVTRFQRLATLAEEYSVDIREWLNGGR